MSVETATPVVLTPQEQAQGYTLTRGGQKEYNPIKMVQIQLERKSEAQKVESMILTQENVKKIQERVGFLEGRLANLYEEFQAFKASPRK